MTVSIGKRGGKEFRLTDEERSRHLHVIGASGTGKSKFLQYMIEQDIINRRGLCLIDPHGTLADDIVRFCASRKIEDHRKVHIIEPGNEEWSVGFNPLRLSSADPMLRVDTMVTACAEVWGGEEIDKTPLLATCLQLVFYALAVHKLTLVEAIELTSTIDPEGIRTSLTEKLPDYVFESYWNDFRGLSRKEFEERFSSTRRRLLRFLGTPLVRRIVGQREHVLDLRKVMDEGDILIVNLAQKGGLSQTSARLLGALLASEFFLAALGRPAETAGRRPYYLYIDECYDFLTGDIERMLDQTRKFGLHLILAHHRLAQLRDRSESIYSGVMAGAQTKIVFGGLMDEDAEIIARQIMRDSFNLERPKHSLDKPVVVGDELIWLESSGTSEGTSHTFGSSEQSGWSETSGSSLSAGEVHRVFENGDTSLVGQNLGEGSSATSGTSGGRTESESVSYSSSTSQGRHQALRSIYEVRTTQVHSLEEEIHLAIVKLREQRNRGAIVKLRGKKAKGITIPNVPDSLTTEKRVAEFRSIAHTSSQYLTRGEVADAELESRRGQLSLGNSAGEAAETETFWNEE